MTGNEHPAAGERPDLSVAIGGFQKLVGYSYKSKYKSSSLENQGDHKLYLQSQTYYVIHKLAICNNGERSHAIVNQRLPNVWLINKIKNCI